MTERLTGRLGPYRKPLTGRRSLPEGPFLTAGSLTGMGPFTKKDDEETYGKAGPLREAPYGAGRSLREGPVLTGTAGSLHREGRRRGLQEGWALTRSPLRRGSTRQGPVLEGGSVLTGRAGPYGRVLYEDGSLHTEGRALTGSPYRAVSRAGPYQGPWEEAYGKAGPLQQAPYEKGRAGLYGRSPSQRRTTKRLGPSPHRKRRSLREGPVLTGRSLTGREGRRRGLREGCGKPSGRDGPYGKGRSLREGPLRDGSLHKKEKEEACGQSLREGPVLTEGSFMGMGPFTKKDDEGAYGKVGPLREAPYGERRSLREGPLLTGGSFTGISLFTEKDGPLREAPYAQGPVLTQGSLMGRGLREGWALTASPLRGGTGRSLREGPLRGWVPSQKRTTKRFTGYGKRQSL